MYSCMDEEDALHYEKLKEAILYRYDYTEDGFRENFRKSKAQKNESPEQFIARLKGYLRRWIELAPVEQTYDGIVDLILRE